MYLFIETPYYSKKQKTIVKKTNKVIFETTLQTLGDPNRNNRVYEPAAIKEALAGPDIKERMECKSFGGELDHPIPTSDQVESQVRHTTFMFKEASHAFTECNVDGNEVNAVVETLSTPNGYTMAGLISDGVKVGFSLRAIGDNVKSVGRLEYVQPPVTIIAYDCVSFPSHKGAYMGEIKQMEQAMLENLVCKDGICFLVEHINKTKGKLLSENTIKKNQVKICEAFKSKKYFII